LDRVILAGRPGPGRSEAATQVKHLANTVTEIDFDAEDTGSHAELINSVFTAGDIDIVLLAFGVLGDQEEAERHPAAAVEVAQINYVGAVSIGLNVAQRLDVQGHGVLVVLSSVAGERARRSNFVYGHGPRVLVVRPGFVRTKMTAHLPDAPLAVDADEVAERIVTAIRKGRETVYAPGAMRVVMSGLRHLPRPVFRRLPF
jgi:decaprenylphospho-beta-D-erythro-pentofuranosid-2-ulose 2-reductase